MSPGRAASARPRRAGADPVRGAAHAALLSFEKTPLHADELVGRFDSEGFDARDRAFLRELIYGVLRWRNRLDLAYGSWLDRPRSRLSPPVREALRLGAYQILFLDRVPVHSAVDTSVALASRKGEDWARALVNAVLRRVAERGPEPPADMEDRLVEWESHPRWLVRRWLRDLGPDAAEARCRANNEEGPVVLRVSLDHGAAHEVASRLREEGVATRPGRLDPDCLLLDPGKTEEGSRFSETRIYKRGGFIVQDEASSLIARYAAPPPGALIWDACAAPGGKAAALIWTAGEGARGVASDAGLARLGRLKRNCARIGAPIRVAAADAVHPPFGAEFDLVLVDAPCSGIGVLRRHPDARWRLSEEDIAPHAARQLEILRGASLAVRPGGVLVYSACTNEPEETEGVARSFKERGFTPQGGAGALPDAAHRFVGEDGAFRIRPEDGSGTDGFFAMRWRREG